MSETTCITPGCDASVHVKKRGLCKRHYDRARAAGEFDHERGPHRITVEDRESMLGVCTYCGPGIRIVIRKSRSVCWESERRSSRKSRHGLSPDDALALVDAVDWYCEICGDDLEKQPYCIDHDHGCCPGSQSCGQCVRGILCRRCNVGIGMLRDDEAIVAAALEYLTSKNSLLRANRE